MGVWETLDRLVRVEVVEWLRHAGYHMRADSIEALPPISEDTLQGAKDHIAWCVGATKAAANATILPLSEGERQAARALTDELLRGVTASGIPKSREAARLGSACWMVLRQCATIVAADPPWRQ